MVSGSTFFQVIFSSSYNHLRNTLRNKKARRKELESSSPVKTTSNEDETKEYVGQEVIMWMTVKWKMLAHTLVSLMYDIIM